ncbi:putative DNA modification/repair radical SAM protein [Candidatus Dependentiae bacterium]|nr:putative DNA modification/repair radical SAM protein [Candidatus Dependentiae bacterium]
MDTLKKIEILADAAKYDVSCSSSGSKRINSNAGIGNACHAGICHSWADDGRCISLLKILFTNYCIYDCAYCVNRRSNDVPRAAFTPDEIAEITMNFYRRNYIEGLFLSSGVLKSPDYTMEQLIRAVKKLRNEYKYNGYIHLKAIPGASAELLLEAGRYADRFSANIELPSEKSLTSLAPEKKKNDILGCMQLIDNGISAISDERRIIKKADAPLFTPAGQSTQMIIGATPETDLHIIKLSDYLYKKYHLKRVYYSAFVPVSEDSRLPALNTPPLLRENRLYQCDWLMRFYQFSADEILDETQPFLEQEFDPKLGWALRHPEFFPLEINTADYEKILRIPGIGVLSAKRIVGSRRYSKLRFEDLKKLGVVLKRARYFITCMGKYYDHSNIPENKLKKHLLEISNSEITKTKTGRPKPEDYMDMLPF